MRNRIEIGTQSVVEKLRIIGYKSEGYRQILDEFYELLNKNLAKGTQRGISKNKITSLAESVLSDERIERLASDSNLSVFGKETPIFGS